MCVQIDSRCVLFNLLRARVSTDFACLQSFLVKMKAKVPCVSIDISDSSILAVIEDNPGLFALTEHAIRREAAFIPLADKTFLDKTVNRHLPPTVRQSLHEVCESMPA